MPAAIPPSSCYDMNDIVVVSVEDVETETVKEYKFFRKLLAWHSSYFAAALDPEGWFMQTDADVLELQDSHKVFDAFQSWMYTGRLMDPGPPNSPIQDIFLSDEVLYDTSCYDATDLVRISVFDGSQNHDYTVPRKLVAWHSSYFAAATDPNGGFAENSRRVVNIECSRDVFEAFYCWMHTSRLKDLPEGANGIPVTECYLPSKVLIDLWIFADYHGIPALGNSAIDMLHERAVAQWPSVADGVAQYIYNHTRWDSNLRDFISDWTSMTTPDTYTFRTLSLDRSKDPAEFLHDVYPKICVRFSPASRRAAQTEDRCRWHDHSGPGGRLRLELRN
ncbi:hypothetical protein E8E13_008788 [Curvularia kusanoi]|uniref:BTB domain-containing protein n=1 Tax=Curvularia kusanoi TaxID=90978 RepID=A0A9P4TFQ2_CURKU|nr:hypothetical protein E8E13_008788 [Curvularia kusanoi]